VMFGRAKTVSLLEGENYGGGISTTQKNDTIKVGPYGSGQPARGTIKFG